MHKPRFTAGFIAALLLGALALPAAAQHAGVKGNVMVIFASKNDGKVDKELRKLPALKKEPFDAYKTMKVLSKHAITLKTGKAVSVELPNGRHLKLNLLERMKDGRHKVQVSINRPKKKDYLPLLQVMASGEPFFVAGQKYKDGMLIIVVRISESKAK